MHCDLQVLNYTFVGIKMANFCHQVLKQWALTSRGRKEDNKATLNATEHMAIRKGMNTKLQKFPVTHPVANRTSFF